MDHEGCEKCKQHSHIFNKIKHCLCVHLHVSILNKIVVDKSTNRSEGAKPPLKKGKKQEILNNVSALRNSKGGILLVHVEGLNGDDNNLGIFDEFIDDELDRLITDGATFDDIYFKSRLKEDPEFIVIDVEPSSTIIITDAKTKFLLDKGFKSDSVLALKNQINNLEEKDKDPRKPILLTTDPCKLTEKRDVQLKSFTFGGHTNGNKVKQTNGQKEKDYVHHLWSYLRLPEYITAFAKLRTGGCFIAGIGEIHKQFETEVDGEKRQYVTTAFDVHGIQLTEAKREEIKGALQELYEDTMVYVSHEGKCPVPVSAVSIEFHELENKKCLLEIAVNPLSGILFYDKEGPEAYRIVQEEPFLRCTRCPLEDIFTSIDRIRSMNSEQKVAEQCS